jgi:hypothetical protein
MAHLLPARKAKPVSTNPSFFCTAREARLKWNTPEARFCASVVAKYQSSAARTASLMRPRFQNCWASQ